jgi:hypothetical protein
MIYLAILTGPSVSLRIYYQIRKIFFEDLFKLYEYLINIKNIISSKLDLR